MELPPFFTGPIPFGRIRTLDIFKPPFVPERAKEVEINVNDLFVEVKSLAERAKGIKDKAAEAAAAFIIPIDDDENEVRAAHRRIFGGDGTAITFAQFRELADNRQDKWKEIWKYNDFKGYGNGDNRAIDRKKISSRLRRPADRDSIGDLSSFGSQPVIMWALNLLLGAQHASGHSAITSGKYPPGTETGGVLSQIIQSLIMMIYVQGLTNSALEAVTQLDTIEESVQESFKAAYK